jgi:hypothetical protein
MKNNNFESNVFTCIIRFLNHEPFGNKELCFLFLADSQPHFY